MSRAEIYYVFANEQDSIPNQSEWYSSAPAAEEDALSDAENDPSNTVVVYKITVEPIKRSAVTVVMENA